MGDLTRNFSVEELECSCCGMNKIDIKLGILLEIARHFNGDKSIIPSSGCRCYEYNEKIQHEVNPHYVSNSSKSKHLEGMAVDIPVDNPKGLYDLFDSLFPDMFGIGLYNSFVHIDTRRGKARWDSRT